MAVEPVGTKNDWEVNLLGAISATDIISIIKKEIEDFDWDDSARETGEVIWVGDGIATIYGIDHAMYGAEILFDQEKIWDYIDRDAITKDELLFLRKVISCHSAYRVPQDYTDREKQFADILRDADKIDILKVNVDVPLEEIYNVTSKDLANAEVTQAVMDSFAQKHATLRALKRTSVDHVVGHISLVYELVYPYSVKVVVQQGYLDKLMHFQSQNPHTMEQFAQLRQMMDSYIADRLQS